MEYIQSIVYATKKYAFKIVSFQQSVENYLSFVPVQ